MSQIIEEIKDFIREYQGYIDDRDSAALLKAIPREFPSESDMALVVKLFLQVGYDLGGNLQVLGDTFKLSLDVSRLADLVDKDYLPVVRNALSFSQCIQGIVDTEKLTDGWSDLSDYKPPAYDSLDARCKADLKDLGFSKETYTQAMTKADKSTSEREIYTAAINAYVGAQQAGFDRQIYKDCLSVLLESMPDGLKSDYNRPTKTLTLSGTFKDFAEAYDSPRGVGFYAQEGNLTFYECLLRYIPSNFNGVYVDTDIPVDQDDFNLYFALHLEDI